MNALPDKTNLILDPDRSMKPLLAKCIEEAVHIALIDCCFAEAMDDFINREGIDAYLNGGADEIKTRWVQDYYAIPSEYIARMDPGALAQNVALRLLGPGGWMVGGVYAGNATARDIFDASFERPDRSHVSELAFDVLQAMEAAHEVRTTDDDESTGKES